MDSIVKKLIENHRVDEMAMEQSKAISHCKSLGKQFILHYHKVYVGGISDKYFEHHCEEMQAWYDDVKSIRLKSNNKFISKVHLVDWFFTAGAGVEDFLEDEKEKEIYEEFIIKLLGSNKEIIEIIPELLSSE